MSSSTRIHRAAGVDIRADRLAVELEDGRRVSVPLDWFPRLQDASREELHNWRLIGNGEGIRWPDVDEDVSVHSLLHPEDTLPGREIRDNGEGTTAG